MRGPHGGPRAVALFGTKYARCAQLWPLNYLVRVSLFIEYRACLFLRRACVSRCKKRERERATGVLKGRWVGRTARGGGFSLPSYSFFIFFRRVSTRPPGGYCSSVYICTRTRTEKAEVVEIPRRAKVRPQTFACSEHAPRAWNKQACHT